MKTVKVYLKSGRSFDIQAEVVRCKHNTITGELISLSYDTILCQALVIVEDMR